MRAALFASLLAVGCGGSSGSGEPAVDYQAELQPLWNFACTCHLQGQSGTMIADTLTLNDGMSHAELLSASTQLPDMPRVTPGDPEQSYAWHKLQGTHLDVGGSTAAMPMIGMLSDEELALVEAWIEDGAPQ
jgi:hypothetical protein